MTTAGRRALVAMLVAGSALTAAVVGQSLAELIHGPDGGGGGGGGGEENLGGGGGGGSLVAAVLREGGG